MTNSSKPPSLPRTVSCPKLPRESSGYRYYAGYSPSFVYDILSRWPGHALILDPWNGSGTTTAVAAKLGLTCLGVDLNPAMIVVARAALLSEEDTSTIICQAQRLQKLRLSTVTPDSDDPLLEWLDRSSVARLRGLQEVLVGSTRFTTNVVAELSSAKAYWLTLLFTIVRQGTRAFQSSNPTWIKRRGKLPAAKLLWRQLVSDLYAAAMTRTPSQIQSPATSRVVLGSSTSLAHYDISPDVVLGSPPYCTRLDYAIATRIELSVLGLTFTEQEALRRELMGTTTVPRLIKQPIRGIGRSALATLTAIEHHPSKASQTYYWKWIAQYFNSYSASLTEVARITSRTGIIGLVVQDSYYKEIHIDLHESRQIFSPNTGGTYIELTISPRVVHWPR